MSPLPEQLSTHWRQRPGRRPGRAEYHWHMLFGDQPKARKLAALAQRKLAGLPGLDPVPLQWLHLTTLVVGFADEVPDRAVASMVDTARNLLGDTPPVEVSLGRVYYHPEAVVLLVDPPGALDPVLSAVSISARDADCEARTDTDPWVPHISVAYSNGSFPAAPVIAALGSRLPETEIAISSVTLVAQTQVGRSWQWQPVADVTLGGARGA
jgi:2'-5' RNA ligase